MNIKFFKGQIQVSTIMGIIAFMSSIAVPVLYIGDIKTNVAVQAAKLQTVTDKEASNAESIDNLSSNVQFIREVIAAMAVKQGLDLQKLDIKK